MLQKIKAMDDKLLTKLMMWTSLFFIVSLFVLSYLAGSNDYISFGTAVVLWIISFLPALAVMVLMFIHGDAQTRRTYLFRIVLAVIVFGGLNLYRYLSN